MDMKSVDLVTCENPANYNDGDLTTKHYTWSVLQVNQF